MSNSITRQFSVIGAGTALSLLLGLVTTPVITRAVDTAQYGRYSVFVMYASLATVVLMLGLDQSYLRFFNAAEKEGEANRLFYSCIKLPVLVTLIIGTVAVTVSALSPRLDIRVTLCFCIYTLSLILLKQVQLTARLTYRSAVYSALTVADKALYIIAALAAIFLLGQKSAEALMAAITLAAAAMALLGFVLQYKTLAPTAKAPQTASLSQLLRYGYPYIFSLGLTVMLQSADKITLSLFTDYSEIGIYKSAESMVNIFAVVQTTFSALWMPLAIKRYEADPDDRSFHADGNEIISLLMFLLGGTVIALKDLLVYWLGADYRGAAYILPALIMYPIMYTISETTVVGAVFAKKSHSHIVVAAVSCVTNIIGNLLLVPHLGGRGAAISTGLSYIVFFLLRTAIGRRYYDTGAPLYKCFILTALTAAYALYSMFDTPRTLGVIFYLILVGCALILYKDKVIFIIRHIRKKGTTNGTEKRN